LELLEVPLCVLETTKKIKKEARRDLAIATRRLRTPLYKAFVKTEKFIYFLSFPLSKKP
jgi:hypothetical protein